MESKRTTIAVIALIVLGIGGLLAVFVGPVIWTGHPDLTKPLPGPPTYSPQEPVADEGVVHIATEEYPPHSSERLKYYGVNCRIITEAFRTEGIEVVYHFLPAARAYTSAQYGHVDATTPWAMRESRKVDFLYGEPIIESSSEHFFHLRGTGFQWDPVEQPYSDLAGMRIGAVTGYDYGEAFQAAEEAGVITVERVLEVEQNFRKLLSGNIQLVISESRVGEHILQTHFSEEDVVRIAHVPQNAEPTEYDYLLFTRKRTTSPALLEAFNRGLAKLKASDRYDQYILDLAKGEYAIEQEDR